MRGYIFKRVFLLLPFAIVFIGLLGFVVMSLWNWLMPAIFKLGTITYWQAWGLLILGRLLVGGFRLGGHHGPPRRWRRGMRNRWAHMSPEEREKFRRGIWGLYAPPEAPEQPGQ